MLVRYDCENGTDEANVVATDPDGFDFVDIDVGSGAEFKYDTAMGGARGSQAIRFATTTPSAVARAEIAFTGNLLYAVTYFNPGSSWASTAELIRLVTSLGGRMVAVRVNASREVLLVNAAGTNVASSTALAANAWHRIELRCDVSNGQATIRIYSGADLHTATETQTLGPISSGYGQAGTAVSVDFGQATGGTGVGPGWIDEFGASDEGWMGAAVDPTAPPPAPSSTVKANLFENTLADDTALTPANSGYPMNDAFDDVIGSVLMRTRSVGGSRYALASAEASTGVDKIAGLHWEIDGNDVVLDARFLATWPKSSFVAYEVRSRNGKTLAKIVLRPDGSIQLRDRHNTVLANQPTTKIPDGNWCRIRMRVLIHATTPASNLFRVAIFTNEDASTATETVNNNGADVGPPGRSIRQARIGVLSPSKVAVEVGIDSAAVSDAGVPAAPTITSLSHASRNVGEALGAEGTNYIGATGVKFTGPDSTFVNSLFTVEDAEHISAIVPEGAVTGPVIIQTLGGEVTSGASVTINVAGPLENVEFTDVTPGTGINEANVSAYEGGNAIPEMTFDQDYLYEITLTSYEAGGAAQVPVPVTEGLTWEQFGPTYQSGAHAMASYRCRPAAAVTAVTTVSFTATHERIAWLIAKYNKFDGSGANGSSAIGSVSDIQASTSPVTSALLTNPEFTVARKNLLVAVLQVNVQEAITPVSPAVGSGEVQSSQTPTRTLKKARVDDAASIGVGWTTPATYRGYTFEVVSGSGTGTGGGGGGGGGGGWTPPSPNTDPNPTPDITLTAPMTTSAINAAIAAIPGGPIGAKVRMVGDFELTADFDLYDDMWIFGDVGSPARIRPTPALYGEAHDQGATLPNSFGFSGKHHDARRVTLSDLRIDGWGLRGVIPWHRWLVRRCEIDHCGQNGVGGTFDHVSPYVIFDTCHIHHNGNWNVVGHTPGGSKFLETGKCGDPIGSGVNFISCETDHNVGPGLWWDHTCAGDTMYGCYSHHNTRTGARWEICAGPAEWRGNRVEYNGLPVTGHTYGHADSPASQWAGGGVVGGFDVTSAHSISIISNTFLGNVNNKAITITEEERAVLNCGQVGGAKRGYFAVDHKVLGNILNGGKFVINVPAGAPRPRSVVEAAVTYDPAPV